MLNGFTVWNRLTLVPKKLILLALFMLEIPLSISFFHTRYASFLDANPWMRPGWQLLLFAFCVFYFAGVLFRMAQKEMEDFSLIAYWTSLSDCGCDTYIICTLIPWMELSLLFALTFGNYHWVHPMGIVIGVLGVDAVFIRMGVRCARVKSVRGKSQKGDWQRKAYIVKSPALQMLVLSFKQRLRCWDMTAMIIVFNLIFIALCQLIKGNILFVVSIIFMMFLYLFQDRFFESEGMNFTYYKNIGIPFKKYLRVQVCTSILYCEILVLVFFVIYSQSVLQIVLFLSLLLFFSFYWNVSFIYIESRKQERFLKFWYEIISFWISVIPIINLLWIYTKYKKLQKEWNYD